MKSRRAITIGLTFIAGLYFILDFIVPPTLPGASVQGVVVSITPATFSAATQGQPPITYQFSQPNAKKLKIYFSQRDILGAPKLQEVPLRQVGVGSTVTLREGPFVVQNAPSKDIVGPDGLTLQPGPGQHWIDPSSEKEVTVPSPGMELLLEQPNAKLTATDPGAAELIVNGKRITYRLGSKTAVIKIARFGAGDEVRLDELRTGDTAQFGPNTLFADNRDTASRFNLVITTMAFGIGLLSLGMVHSRTLFKLRPGWSLSLVFFLAVVLGVAAGIGKYNDPGTSSRAFSDFIVLRIISSVTATVFSLLAFYMAAAAYRAFRVRTWEAGLMMTSALIVMLGQTPFGLYMTSWMGEKFSALWLPNVAAWILRVPNTAVFRGLIFGIMLGSVSTALRYWLSMERSVRAED
jgi:hypothetical protein